MTFASRLAERLGHIPAARTRAVRVRRDIEIVMPDGVTLLADRYRAGATGTEPIILMRSPYGRGNVWGLGARLFAERGFQVLVQSCRGTGGSGGEFDAYRHEAEDGLTTLAWIERQPWFSGKMAMFGPSYLGIVQWQSPRTRRNRCGRWLPRYRPPGFEPSPIRRASSLSRAPWRGSGFSRLSVASGEPAPSIS
jgi:hypothetical protein